jgi:formylglycine-generating enzyme required for sulfatase activity
MGAQLMGIGRRKMLALSLLALGGLGLGFLLRGGKQCPSPAKQELVNSIGMKLVPVPAGEFLMGGQETAEELVLAFPVHNRKAEEFRDEYPRHRVRITRSFYLAKFEVTVGQFRSFVEDSRYKTEPETDAKGGWGYDSNVRKCVRRPGFSWRDPGFKQTDEHPVVNVTWNDCVAFCCWLSRKEGKRYRLPTEAEWEYCCRAGTTTRFHNGDDPDALAEVGRVAYAKGKTSFPHFHQMEIQEDTPQTFTAPVGSYSPNRWGLHDMHGNVWEWCSDWHDDDYYAQSPIEDPPGTNVQGLRVRRGGGWNTFPIFARASYRNWHSPQSRCLNLGFRVVREAEVSE